MVMASAILISFFDHKEEGGPKEAYNKQLEEKKAAAADTAAADDAPKDEAAPEEEEKSDLCTTKCDRRWPVIGAFNLCISNHMGTAALGSFFITLVVVERIIVAYFLKKAEDGDKSGTVKYIAACINCIM